MARRKQRSRLSAQCQEHPDATATQRCIGCGRGLCEPCFRFTIDRKPGCARCAYEASTRPQRRVSLAVVFLTFAAGMWVWLARKFELWREHEVMLGLGAASTVVVAALIAASARGQRSSVVEGRDQEEPYETTEDVTHPYRAGARRVLLAMSPRISGKATAAVVMVCLVTAAVLVPASLRLPRWIEAEIVLALWWTIMAGTLVVLLYRGFRLRDDLVYFAPWDRPAGGSSPLLGQGNSGSSGGGWGALDGLGSVDGEGCVIVLLVAVVLGGALGAAWVVVEVALPLVFFLLYALLMRAIRRAASDRRGCEGDLAKSLGWGGLWATVYVLPLATLTWLVHAMHR